MFNVIKNLHFVGIGGAGMSGIAEVLVNTGYNVTGSDIKKTAIIERLEQSGIKIFIGHSSDNIQQAQVLVVSSAINKHNPEIIEAENRHIPIIHRSEMLAELMRMKYGIIVAGTHGKTTTTSILASALHAVGLDPTIIIGGKINSFGSSAKLGKGELFVAEADESDGSFLRLTPTIAVITNIDRDHLDHYGSLDEIVKAFEIFVDKVPFYGAVCICIDDPIIQLLIPKIRRRLVTYGIRNDADIYAKDIHTDGLNTIFTPVVNANICNPVKLKMPGKYNVTNALATFAVGSILGSDNDILCKAVDNFEGVQHRYTVLGQINNIIIVDDYAHNPKKIETVLKGTKENFPTKQIIAIFQPHRYTRIKYQIDEFSRCFKFADQVIITPIYSAGEQAIPGIDIEVLARQIKMNSFNGTPQTVHVAENFTEAKNIAYRLLQKQFSNEEGSIVLTLGAGDIRQVGTLILEKLSFDRK